MNMTKPFFFPPKVYVHLEARSRQDSKITVDGWEEFSFPLDFLKIENDLFTVTGDQTP